MLDAQLSFNNEITAFTIDDLNAFLSSQGFDAAIKQKALFPESLLVDENKSFGLAADQNFFDALVNTGHSLNDSVLLEGSFYSSRDKAVAVMLEEKTG
ncbi:hypothetical protein HZB89_00410 [archaeon]|nr:hypothetical protein [archaeon]